MLGIVPRMDAETRIACGPVNLGEMGIERDRAIRLLSDGADIFGVARQFDHYHSVWRVRGRQGKPERSGVIINGWFAVLRHRQRLPVGVGQEIGIMHFALDPINREFLSGPIENMEIKSARAGGDKAPFHRVCKWTRVGSADGFAVSPDPSAN